MSLTYKTRRTDYIDLSNATADDYIEVTLENDASITLVPGQAWLSKLDIDERNTDSVVLAELYQGFEDMLNKQAFGQKWRLKRMMRGIPDWYDLLKLEVSIRADGDAFDHSPRVGESLHVMVIFPKYGGYGVRLQSPVKSVKFS